MLFSSLSFLQLFLPCVLFVYYLVRDDRKNLVLFVFSLLFYGWGEPTYVVLMLISTIVDYFCGKNVQKHQGTKKAKKYLLMSITFNLAMLFTFKYLGFFINTINNVFNIHIPVISLPLPIGISFYTFQTMSYTIDIYCGKAKVQNSFISFGAYVSLFPQLIAGPIVRYQTVADQLDNRVTCFDKFSLGVKRFVVGLAKKVLLANNIGILFETISSLKSLTVLSSWLGIISFALQIYFDFSGYSDMAIGLGKMFGFDFLENFDYPYTSKSITEFWRKWHISMGSWFRDYVYIPLGGNRKGLLIQIRNILIVWLLTGLWHGASYNYLLWGLFYGLILIIEKLFLLDKLMKVPAVFSHIYTIFIFLIGWVLFAYEDLSQGLFFIKSMFNFKAIYDTNSLYLLMNYLPILVICIVGSTPLLARIYHKINLKLSNNIMTFIDNLAVCLLLVLSIAYLISGSYNPFLYFRF